MNVLFSNTMTDITRKNIEIRCLPVDTQTTSEQRSDKRSQELAETICVLNHVQCRCTTKIRGRGEGEREGGRRGREGGREEREGVKEQNWNKTNLKAEIQCRCYPMNTRTEITRDQASPLSCASLSS